MNCIEIFITEKKPEGEFNGVYKDEFGNEYYHKMNAGGNIQCVIFRIGKEVNVRGIGEIFVILESLYTGTKLYIENRLKPIKIN
jgi:hypothetical protein